METYGPALLQLSPARPTALLRFPLALPVKRWVAQDSNRWLPERAWGGEDVQVRAEAGSL